MSRFAGKHKEVNAVHQDAILNETISKELRSYKPYTNFSINPFTPMYTVTGKPNSFRDAQIDQGEEDQVMKQLIELAHKPPTEKHIFPQTTSQEYGWINKPLMKVDRNDPRLHFAKKITDVTETKEAEWRLKEQTQNM